MFMISPTCSGPTFSGSSQYFWNLPNIVKTYQTLDRFTQHGQDFPNTFQAACFKPSKILPTTKQHFSNLRKYIPGNIFQIFKAQSQHFSSSIFQTLKNTTDYQATLFQIFENTYQATFFKSSKTQPTNKQRFSNLQKYNLLKLYCSRP